MVSMDYADAGWKGTLIWAIHPLRKYAVVYQEWKEKGREIEEQVREATKLLGPRAEAKTTQWVVDRSAPLLEYQKWGAPVVASKSNPGQKANLISTANGLLHQGRIFVLRENCPQFLYEAARFVRKPESDRPFADDRKPGSVVKKDDHLCDPFLYGCAELTLDLGSYEQPAALEEEKVPWPPPPPPGRLQAAGARADRRLPRLVEPGLVRSSCDMGSPSPKARGHDLRRDGASRLGLRSHDGRLLQGPR
jgi:hypothetical protein